MSQHVTQCKICMTPTKLKPIFLFKTLKTNRSSWPRQSLNTKPIVIAYVCPCSNWPEHEKHSQIFILCKQCNFVHVNINHHVVGHLYKNKKYRLIARATALAVAVRCDATKLKANVLLATTCHIYHWFQILDYPFYSASFSLFRPNQIWRIFLFCLRQDRKVFQMN